MHGWQKLTHMSLVKLLKWRKQEPVITFLIVTALFGFGGYFIGQQWFDTGSTQVQVQQAKDSTLVGNTIRSQTLQHLLSMPIEGNFEQIERNTMWWISDDNWSISVGDSESLGLVRTNAYVELQDAASETTSILESISSYFIEQGFRKNDSNSSDSIADKTFYDFVLAFENDTEKCVLSVSPDESYYNLAGEEGMKVVPNIIVSCSDLPAFQTSYAQQIPFLKAVNERNVIIQIEAETESAAKASVKYRRTGSFALFSKMNGNWEMIYKGQDQPSCQVLKAYAFPASIHEACSPS